MHRIYKFHYIAFLLIASTTNIFARAGGGGGGGGGFSGGGGGGGFSGGGGYSGGGGGDPLVTLLIIIGFIIFKVIETSVERSSTTPIISGSTLRDDNKVFKKIQAQLPELNVLNFKKSVENNFIAIQRAWSNQELTSVRPFISDGIWQRFHVQFLMMQQLEQSNSVTNVQVHKVSLVGFETQGLYDILHVGIQASCRDAFQCALDSSLNSTGNDIFVEYWSFIRKRSATSHNFFSTNLCPSCGAALPTNMGEVAQCTHCEAVVNSGEYDWVLSEITQENDWDSRQNRSVNADLENMQELLIEEDPDFNRQTIEDLASNAYLQLMAAETLSSPKLMRRFVTDNLYSRLESRYSDKNFVFFNRLYLNEVVLQGIRRTEDVDMLYVLVSRAAQKVSKGAHGLHKVDSWPRTEKQVIVLQRTKGATQSKHSIYMHQCGSCGASIEDTLDTACSYCQSSLNSNDHQWIVADLISLRNYNGIRAHYAQEFLWQISNTLATQLRPYKEHVIINLLVMAFADNNYTSEEQLLLHKMQRKLNYPKNKLDHLTEKAREHKLSIAMPQDQKMQEKVLKIMRKLAIEDGYFSKPEEDFLEVLQESYGQFAPPEFKVTL